MNLDRYRAAFNVFVATSDMILGREVANQLERAGYTCEQRSSHQSLCEEIIKNPPHIIILTYGDQNFFPTSRAYQEIIESLLTQLPEVQIIFLSQKEKMKSCADLYEFGIYDCIAWPLEHPRQLLRSVDRAGETNYYMYLNEHLRDKPSPGPRAADMGMYQVWLKEIESTRDHDDAAALFVREAVRYLQAEQGYYFRYREAHRSLLLTKSFGADSADVEGVGLDLAALEPGFMPALLAKPHQLFSLQEFVKKGLSRRQAVIMPLQFRDQILGVFVVPARLDQVFRDDCHDDAYLGTCLMALKRHFEMSDLRDRLKRLTVFDFESEAFQPEVINAKLREEVVRARRILRPVTALVLQLDGFADLTLSQTSEVTRVFLKAFHEILRSNSRLNDLVGRLSLDQFLVCLPHTELRGAVVKAERLRRIIESADFSAILGTSKNITVSIGVSEYPARCHDAIELHKSAEGALNEIKRTGRNRVGVAALPARFEPDFVVTDDHRATPAPS